jgi:hypothetical protein
MSGMTIISIGHRSSSSPACPPGCRRSTANCGPPAFTVGCNFIEDLLIFGRERRLAGKRNPIVRGAGGANPLTLKVGIFPEIDHLGDGWRRQQRACQCNCTDRASVKHEFLLDRPIERAAAAHYQRLFDCELPDCPVKPGNDANQ